MSKRAGQPISSARDVLGGDSLLFVWTWSAHSSRTWREVEVYVVTLAPAPPLSRSQIEERVDTLPTLPAVVTEIVSLDPASEEFHLRLRDVALRDPPLAVRVIAAANSATYAPVTPVLSLPEAIMRLGGRHVAQLITSVSVMRVFVPKSEGHRNLWRHAIQVAVAARTLATVSSSGVDPQHAYVLGLLHDIGRFVMFEHDPIDFEAVEGARWSTPSELLAFERALCGFDHAELGCHAATVWALPESLAESIRHHHAAELDGSVPAPIERLIRIVQLSDALSCVLMSRPHVVTLDAEARRGLVEPLCVPGLRLSASDIAAAAGRIHDESVTLAAALGIRPLTSPAGFGPKGT